MSNETHFTPAPWYVDEDADGLMVKMDDLGGKDEYLAIYASPDPDRRRADAYLIAAAPELLDAAERALQYIERHCHELMPADRVSLASTTLLRAAIAKATGGSR